MRPISVLVCGHVTLDRSAHGFVPGGSLYYAAHAYRALGADVRVITAAGADHPADALRGLAAEVQPAPCTTRFANRYGRDGRRTQTVEAAAPPLDPGRVPAPLRTADLVHLAPVLGEVDLVTWRATLRARFLGIGVQGWVRAVGADGTVVPRRWSPEAAELSGVDAACLGEEDLAGQPDLLDRLVAAVPLVAFTHGARGCDLVVRGRTRRIGVFPAREVDPTGAGDVFSAALFLSLARGADPVEAARLGAAAASIVIEAPAGEALARIQEATARAAAVPVMGERG